MTIPETPFEKDPEGVDTTTYDDPGRVEEIDVTPMDEPDEQPHGEVDPGDTYTEGGAA